MSYPTPWKWPLRVGLLALLAVCGVTAMVGAPLSVDLASREEARQFYRTVWGASETAAMGFTGDVPAGRAGDTTAAYKEAVLLRVNFFRAYAGIPAEVQFSAALNAKCQQAALLSSLNNRISHTPPATSRGYTADAAEASINSNLSLRAHGAAAIASYIQDAGDNNRDVGHRRWILYPQTKVMGTGDVPASGDFNAANALWILDSATYGTARPATRGGAVAWPPAGYVPHTLVYARWSLSVGGADFSQAFVSVKRNGVEVPVAVASVNGGYGESTIVWSIEGQNPSSFATHPRPAVDVNYAVEVSNVTVGGATQAYRYTVTVFDPDVVSPGGLPQRLAGPASLAPGQTGTYATSAPGFLSRLQWRSVRLEPGTPLFDAEGGAGLGGMSANTSGYDPVVTHLRGAGAAGFRLNHSPPVQAEHTLTLPDSYFAAGPGATLTFLSRLGYATASQTARVQISTDDGNSWSDVYTQAGDGSAGETAFVARSVSLASLEGRTFRVRFNYSLGATGSFFDQVDPGVGWYFDTISLAGVSKVTPSTATDLAGATFAFTRPATGEVGLQLRGLIDAYPTEWSSVFVIGAGTATGSGSDPSVPLPGVSTGSARLANLSVRTVAGHEGAALVVGFNLAGPTAKPMLLRAIGPTLRAFGVAGALSDPRLVLRDASGRTLLENDDWGGAGAVSAAAGRLGAFAIEAGSRDAAVLPSLTPGSYTVTVAPAAAAIAPGEALVELYDAEATSPTRLANVSSRAQLGDGSVLVVGFAVGGTGTRSVLIRAVGPTLANFGVAGALADPRLEINRDGAIIRTSDNWSANLAPLFPPVGAFPLASGSRDAALALALEPGTYTAQISGVGNAGGAVLVEVYELP